MFNLCTLGGSRRAIFRSIVRTHPGRTISDTRQLGQSISSSQDLALVRSRPWQIREIDVATTEKDSNFFEIGELLIQLLGGRHGHRNTAPWLHDLLRALHCEPRGILNFSLGCDEHGIHVLHDYWEGGEAQTALHGVRDGVNGSVRRVLHQLALSFVLIVLVLLAIVLIVFVLL